MELIRGAGRTFAPLKIGVAPPPARRFLGTARADLTADKFGIGAEMLANVFEREYPLAVAARQPALGGSALAPTGRAFGFAVSQITGNGVFQDHRHEFQFWLRGRSGNSPRGLKIPARRLWRAIAARRHWINVKLPWHNHSLNGLGRLAGRARYRRLTDMTARPPGNPFNAFTRLPASIILK
jgi:hypothetical protein